MPQAPRGTSYICVSCCRMASKILWAQTQKVSGPRGGGHMASGAFLPVAPHQCGLPRALSPPPHHSPDQARREGQR